MSSDLSRRWSRYGLATREAGKRALALMKSKERSVLSAEASDLRSHSRLLSTLRLATASDAEVIATQRRQMFTENGLVFQGDWEEFERAFVAWVTPRMLDGSYIGWLAEDNGQIVAGAGVWFMDWPPHYRHIEPVRGYLLNFYTAPEARGRGLAKELVCLAVNECRARGISLAVLHATRMGEPVYRRLGFQPGNEMTLSISPGVPR